MPTRSGMTPQIGTDCDFHHAIASSRSFVPSRAAQMTTPLGVREGMNGERTPPVLAGTADLDPKIDRAPLGHHQRVVESQVVHARAADPRARVQSDVHQGGTGEQDGAVDGMVGEPGVRGGGDAPGGHQTLAGR